MSNLLNIYIGGHDRIEMAAHVASCKDFELAVIFEEKEIDEAIHIRRLKECIY